MKPDVIVCWPRSCDYPLWRQFIHDNRWRFAKVIVAFTEHDGLDYRPFVEWAMKLDDVQTIFVGNIGYGDWRDFAVNVALLASSAKWVWFTEQDFIINQPKDFWFIAGELPRYGSVLGWHEGLEQRLHPSCLFVERLVIDATSRNFGVTERGDHFAQFTEELPRPGVFLVNNNTYEHLQGLTQNHWLVDSGQAPTGIFNEARFKQYLRDCMEVTVPLDPGWVERGVHYLRASAA